MNKIFHITATMAAAAGLACGEVDPFADGVYMEDTGVDPIFSTPAVTTYADTEDTQATNRPALLPNDYYFEYLGGMHIHGQGSTVRAMNAFVTMPLLNPRRHVVRGWHLDAKLSGRLTWLHSSGADILDEHHLYTLGGSATLIHQAGQNSQFHIGLTPQVSTDFDAMSHEIFYWGGNVGFSSTVGPKFKYSLGVSVMPDYNGTWVWPLVNFQWRYRPNWEAQLQATRLSVQYVAQDKLRVGPFLQLNRSAWTVKRHKEVTQLRMNNWIAGVASSYRWNWNGITMKLQGDLGFTFYNNFRVRTKNGRHTLERYRTDGGLYARVGIGFEF